MYGRSDLERISIGQPDIWTKATLTSSMRLHWLTLQHSPFHSFACYNLGRHGSNSQSGYGKMILFESLRWSYVINSKRRSAICEVSHSGLFQDTQPAIAKSWVESEKIQVDDGDEKTSWNLSWSCWKPWFQLFLVDFPIEPLGWAGARPSRLKNPQRPTEALSLHSYVMAQLEAIGARRRVLFKISVGWFLCIRLYMVLLSNIFGMNIWIGIITMMGNPMNTYEPGHLHNP